MKDLLSHLMIVPALVPVADAFAGGVVTEAVALRDYDRAALVVTTGAIEDAGISNLVKLQACTAADGSGATDMAFRSRVQLYSTTVDAWSALTQRASTGYNFAAANPVANAVWWAEVTADEMLAALPGAIFLRGSIAETANKTITAAAYWVLWNARYPGAIPNGVIV